MANEQLVTEIHTRLASLRASLRRRLVGEAVAWMLTCMVVSVFVTLAFDYVLHMERPLRGVMMALALAALAWTSCRRLIAPLLTPMTSDDLALLVESRYDQLGDRLISAIQFARGGNPNESQTMIAHVMAEADTLARGLDMTPLVDRARLRRMRAVSGCFLALLIGFTFWQSDVMKLWLQRNVAFAEVDWPQDTYLKVNGQDFTVLRGDDLTVTIEADGSVIPSYATLHVQYPSVGWTEERLELQSSGDRAYTKVFNAVSEEFAFYVTGNDDNRERDKRIRHKVTLIDPPALSECNFVVEYPAYMNKRPEEVSGSQGVLSAPLASTIRVTAKSTKPLRGAGLMLDGRKVGDVTWVGDGVSAEERYDFLGRFTIDSMPSGGKGRSAPVILSFALTDTDGYSSKSGQKYTIEVRTDQAPSVDLRKRKVRGAVTPQAIIPLTIDAEDDYGLASAQVLLSAGAKKLVKSKVEIPLSLSVRKDLKGFKYDIDLQGRELSPGDVLNLSVEMLDTLPDRLGGPNRGLGGPLTLRIVKPEELMAELIRRQKALRMEFVQAIALQKSARDQAASTMRILAGGNVTPEVLRILKAASGSQISVGSECAKAADVLSAILDEMACNRLGSGREHEEMRNGIIEPIKALAQPIASAGAMLNDGRSVDEAKSLSGRIESIVIIQDDILKTMTEILERMQKLETRQDMINTLNMILKWSEDQLKNIDKESDSEAGKVFDNPSGEKGI